MPWLTDLLDAARPVRAPLLVLLAAAIGLLAMPQTSDMLAALDEARTIAGFQFALFLLAFLVWFWSRAAINATDPALTETQRREHPDLQPTTRVEWFRLHLPRWILLLAVAFAIALEAMNGAPWDAAITVGWAVPLLGFVLLRMRIWRWLVARGAVAAPSRAPSRTLATVRPGDRWRVVRTLIWQAPFHDPVAWSVLLSGVGLFVLGATESFVGIGLLGRFGLAVSLATVFPGPGVAIFGMALMIGPLTTITLFADANPIRLPRLGIVAVRVPALLALAVWVLVLAPLWFHLNTVRVVAPVPSFAPPPAPVALAAMFDRWQRACAPAVQPGGKPGGKPGGEAAAQPAVTLHPVVVSLSGGATMAAVWAARVLQAVDAGLPHPAQAAYSCIFAISSVSGGSLGAAAFEAAAKEGARPGCGVASLGARHLDRDVLGPLVGGMVFYDAPRAMLAWAAQPLRWWSGSRPTGGDRAEAIEHGFEHLWAVSHPDGDCGGDGPYALAEPYGRLFEGPAFLPIWIANGTGISTGGRVLTAPFTSSQANGNGHAPYDAEVWPFRAAGDARALLGADVPVSTAINNSARFPYLEPAGELLAAQTVPGRGGKDKRAVQLVDGGYFENEGILTALELIEWLQRRPGFTVEPVLVQATANGSKDLVATEVVRCGSGPDDPSEVPRHSLVAQIVAPLLGLYNVRGGHSAVYLRGARDLLCPAATGSPQRFFHFMLPGTPTEDVPLNWTLSRTMAAWIWAAFDDVRSGNHAEAARLSQTLRARAGDAGRLADQSPR